VAHLFELVGEHHYARLDVPCVGVCAEDVMAHLSRNVPSSLFNQPVKASLDERGYKYVLADGSWLLFRSSGTEPLVRLYAEAGSPERVQELLQAGKEMAGLSGTPTPSLPSSADASQEKRHG